MKRALPMLVLTVAALIPLLRFEPEANTETSVVAEPAPSVTAEGGAEVVAGPNVRTRYGDVQVEVTFAGDRITAVRMLRQPDSGPTSMAVPRLLETTMEVQSAEVDSVSGATTTSGAYVESLQAAIDAKVS
jgi:uncharacterized protein with FMN-binding domain